MIQPVHKEMAGEERVSQRDETADNLEPAGYGCSGCGWTLPADISFHEALRRFGQTHNSIVHFGQEEYLTRHFKPRVTPFQHDIKPFDNGAIRYVQSFW